MNPAGFDEEVEHDVRSRPRGRRMRESQNRAAGGDRCMGQKGGRGERHEARRRSEKAAQTTPPLLPVGKEGGVMRRASPGWSGASLGEVSRGTRARG